MSFHEAIRPQDLELFLGAAEEPPPPPRIRQETDDDESPANLEAEPVSNPANTSGNGRTDAVLVHSARAGNRTDFGELVDRYQKRAAWVAFRLLGNREDALEVSQEAFIRTWSRLADLKEPEKFGAWLLRTVTNLSLNFRRDRRGTGALPLDDALAAESGRQEPAIPGRPTPSGPQAQMSAGELNRAARAAIDRLPHKQRMAVILFGLEGLPQQQVAEVLDTSVEAVKWHVFQARKKLREMLKDYL